jgi:hypothetical protein
MTTDRTAKPLTNLARQLISSTDRRVINWEVAGEEASFSCKLTAGTATIESVDKDGREPFKFSLTTPSGELVDYIETEWYGEEDGDAEPASWNSLLTDLFEAARRSALKIDGLVDAMVQELKSKETQ